MCPDLLLIVIKCIFLRLYITKKLLFTLNKTCIQFLTTPHHKPSPLQLGLSCNNVILANQKHGTELNRKGRQALHFPVLS